MKRLGVFTRREVGLVVAAAGQTISTLWRTGQFVSAVVLFILTFYITADVCARFFFRAPFKGTLEVSQMGLAIVVFLAIAYTQVLKGHVRLELFVGRLSPRKQAVFGAVYSLAAIGFFILAIRYGMKAALFEWRTGVVTDQLNIPTLPARLAIPVGAFLMVLQLLVDFFKHLKQLASGEAR